MGFKKNTGITGFTFTMVKKTDGSAITSGQVNGYISKDGGAQAGLTNSAVHKGNGQWSVNLTAAEMNGDVIGLLFTHTDAVNVHFTIKTEHQAIEKATKLLVNKAIQNKTTGAVVYYDDDGETELLTHTPTDSDTEITRTPS
jgi:hypothetical protein